MLFFLIMFCSYTISNAIIFGRQPHLQDYWGSSGDSQELKPLAYNRIAGDLFNSYSKEMRITCLPHCIPI